MINGRHQCVILPGIDTLGLSGIWNTTVQSCMYTCVWYTVMGEGVSKCYFQREGREERIRVVHIVLIVKSCCISITYTMHSVTSSVVILDRIISAFLLVKSHLQRDNSINKE